MSSLESLFKNQGSHIYKYISVGVYTCNYFRSFFFFFFLFFSLMFLAQCKPHKCLSFERRTVHTTLCLVLVKRLQSDPLWSELDELSYSSQLAVYCAFSALHRTPINILTVSQKLKIVFMFF